MDIRLVDNTGVSLGPYIDIEHFPGSEGDGQHSRNSWLEGLFRHHEHIPCA